MQRTILLAAVCFQQAQHSSRGQPAWPQQYKELLVGVKGENISTEAGRGRAVEMAEALQHLPLPVAVSIQEPEEMTICIADATFYQVMGNSVEVSDCIGIKCALVCIKLLSQVLRSSA